MKLALAIMIGTSAQMLAEALTLGEANGLDRAQMLEVIAASAVGSPFVGYKAGPLIADDYRSTFSSHLMYKDLRLVIGSANDGGRAGARRRARPAARAGLHRRRHGRAGLHGAAAAPAARGRAARRPADRERGSDWMSRTFGPMNVDWEQRVDMDRLRRERLQRLQGLLAASELGALLCFDQSNIRYVTATHIGTWAMDKLARFSPAGPRRGAGPVGLRLRGAPPPALQPVARGPRARGHLDHARRRWCPAPAARTTSPTRS